jgi:hypothetical protein
MKLQSWRIIESASKKAAESNFSVSLRITELEDDMEAKTVLSEIGRVITRLGGQTLLDEAPIPSETDDEPKGGRKK